jgi:hypothetical protein
MLGFFSFFFEGLYSQPDNLGGFILRINVITIVQLVPKFLAVFVVHRFCLRTRDANYPLRSAPHTIPSNLLAPGLR